MNETNTFLESGINRDHPQTALKIRFIRLTSALVMEVSACDEQLQGGAPAATFTGKTGKVLRAKEPRLENYEIHLAEGVCLTSQFSFDSYKQVLSEFAVNNAFHGIEKPVKRIEYDAEANGSRFYYEGGASPLFPTTTAEQLKEIIGNDFEIYKPKSRFISEWRKISANDVTKPAIYHSERQGDYANGYREGVDALIYMFNKKSPFPEVWEFEMKEAV